MNTTLAQLESALSQSRPPDGEHLVVLAEQLWRSRQQPGAPPLEPEDIELLTRLYRELEAGSPLKHHLLRTLAADAGDAALAAFAELFADDPPARTEDAALACVPLLGRPTRRMAVLFPRVLDALERPTTAALVLDIANHLTKEGWIDEHPARARTSDLIMLLGGLVEGLRRLEEMPPGAANAASSQRQIADSLALIVPLCEALAQIGDASAVGKLYQVLSLGHRRLRVVAAYALARLGEHAGLDALAALAAEPVVRPLALQYLSEMGELQRVAPRHRSPVARAEGELAAWLAHPTRFGLAPAGLELIDASTQPWPGYEQPIDCFLFRFEYRLPRGEFSGVGIAGPVTYALFADLQDLSADDIFALYAGWSSEHEEISETPAEQLSQEQASRWDSWLPEVQQEGYREVQLVKVGHFFGDELFVATGRKAGQSGVLIVEDASLHWIPTAASPRPLGPSEIYWLFIGRRILGAFHRR
jgi:hypothetical protein